MIRGKVLIRRNDDDDDDDDEIIKKSALIHTYTLGNGKRCSLSYTHTEHRAVYKPITFLTHTNFLNNDDRMWKM